MNWGSAAPLSAPASTRIRDYRAQAIAQLAKLSGQKLTSARRHALGHAVECLHGGCSAALRSLALEIIRISNDMRLLASGPNTGLAELFFPACNPAPPSCPAKSIP